MPQCSECGSKIPPGRQYCEECSDGSNLNQTGTQPDEVNEMEVAPWPDIEWAIQRNTLSDSVRAASSINFWLNLFGSVILIFAVYNMSLSGIVATISGVLLFPVGFMVLPGGRDRVLRYLGIYLSKFERAVISGVFLFIGLLLNAVGQTFS
jgi:hypothetical protein